MGKITGFMDYTRKTSTDVPPLERIENFNEFHVWLSREEQQTQAARCMDCGVPFCQAGMMIGGMASGCPLNNLIHLSRLSMCRRGISQPTVKLQKWKS